MSVHVSFLSSLPGDVLADAVHRQPVGNPVKPRAQRSWVLEPSNSPSYKDNENNTAMTTALLMKIGGRASSGSVGIHGGHLDEGSRIHYISTDARRQVIPVVYYTDDKGKTVESVSTDIKVSKQELEKGERRTMDCIDCHNRPTHAFELPENGVDLRMSRGLISRNFRTFTKKQWKC